MRYLSRWRAERRQRRHHRPFRIAAPVWSRDDRALLVASLREVVEKAVPDDGRPDPGPGAADGDLVEAATSLWRAQRRLARLNGDCSPEASAGTRQVRRYLVAVEGALRATGVKVQDHEGTRYDPGLALEVKAWVDRSDLDARPWWRPCARPCTSTAGSSRWGRSSSAAPPTRRPTLNLPEDPMSDTIDYGIDLGTTNSAMAVARNGEVAVVKNNDGWDYTPSAVWMPRPGSLFIGHQARERAEKDPGNAHAEFKQQMGLDVTLTFQNA
jgi:hypothetical protein